VAVLQSLTAAEVAAISARRASASGVTRFRPRAPASACRRASSATRAGQRELGADDRADLAAVDQPRDLLRLRPPRLHEKEGRRRQ
jgi:hypothetical protein